MRVCVIVPTLDEGGQIIPWLKSLANKHAIDQCVVVDASERSDIAAIQDKVMQDKELSFVQYVAANKKGRAQQMNQGADIATGQGFVFLHADTTLPDNAIDQIRKGLQVGWHWGRFDICFDNSSWIYRLIAKFMNVRSRRTAVATGDQAIFMSRAAFDIVRGFDNMALMEDIAISKKLRNIGAPLCLESCVITSARRWEKNGVVKTIVLMWTLRFAYWLGISTDKLVKWYH